MKLVETSSLPAVTLILFSYNQADFVSQAAISCFNQDYAGPLEILLSDDFSTDETFYILKNLTQEYGGPHLVRLRQNSFNQGIGEHYNTAIAEADGDLIFTAAGDDISLPFRVRLVVDAWLANGCRADLISSNLQQIDEQGMPGKIITVSDLGRWKTPVEWLRKRPYVVGAAHAFTSRLHREFGNFLPELVYEDQVMAMRATMAGGGLKVEQVLVLYRKGGISQTKDAVRSAEDYLHWARKNFNRQAAQYRQIRIDLLTKNRGDLIDGRVLRKLQQAELFLAFDKAISLSERIFCAFRHPYCGFFFKLKMLVYLSFPALAAFIRKRQKFFY